MKAAVAAFLVASSAMGAQSEATGLSVPHAYSFEKPLACGKHILPPSVCYPMETYEALNREVQRLQAVEADAKVAGDRRLTFLVGGFILGFVTGGLLGAYLTWLTFH